MFSVVTGYENREVSNVKLAQVGVEHHAQMRVEAGEGIDVIMRSGPGLNSQQGGTYQSYISHGSQLQTVICHLWSICAVTT